MTASAKPEVRAFFHEATNTVSYLVSDSQTKTAVVIDPVLDFDYPSGEGRHTRSTEFSRQAKKQT